MLKLSQAFALVVLTPGVLLAQTPDALTIQNAFNESPELAYPLFQELTDLVIVRGGGTLDGDSLCICDARLAWTVSSEELAVVLQQEITAEVARQNGDQRLWDALNAALAARLNRIDAFTVGDTATTVRLRIRLEQAGADWIATDVTIREFTRNPLKIINQ